MRGEDAAVPGIVNAPMLVDLASINFGARARGPVGLLAIDSQALKSAAEEDPTAGLVLVRNLYRLSLRQLESVIDRLLIDSPH